MRAIPVLFALILSLPLLAQYQEQHMFSPLSLTQRIDGQFGESVAALGADVNGDGFLDLLIGARAEYPPSDIIKSGRAYVVSGADGAILHTLVSPNPKFWGFFGSHVEGVQGDVNGDGIADLLVGAPYENPGSSPTDAGRAYVFSGADGSLLHTLVSPSEVSGGQFGTVVGALAGPGVSGDVNGDGIPDLLVSAPYESALGGPASAGRVHVFSGADGSLLYSVISPNEEAVGIFGWSAAGLKADLNSDGIGDFIVGAYLEDPGSSPNNAGRAYVFSGADGSLLHTLISPNEQSNGYFGRSVSGSGGDVNGDGINDLMVGAFWEQEAGSPEQSGRAYVFSGADGSLIYSLLSPESLLNGWFGYAVGGTGTDADGDGVVDLLVGAPREGEIAGLYIERGRAHLFSGADGSLIRSFSSPNPEPDGWFGCAISGTGGDLNADGIADFIIGAEREDTGFSPNNSGNAHVFSGRGLVCSAAFPPDNQQHSYLSNRVLLNWDPQPGAQACQIQGKRLPTGPQPSLNVLSAPYNSATVPYALAGAGTSWTWRVRCACSLSPLVVSDFSAYSDTFSIPLIRESSTSLSGIEFHPNPAQDEIFVYMNSTDHTIENVMLWNVLGNLKLTRSIAPHERNGVITLDVSHLKEGVYFVQAGNQPPQQIQIKR